MLITYCKNAAMLVGGKRHVIHLKSVVAGKC